MTKTTRTNLQLVPLLALLTLALAACQPAADDPAATPPADPAAASTDPAMPPPMDGATADSPDPMLPPADGSAPDAGPTPPPPPGAEMAGGCNADAVQGLVGQQATDAVVAQATADSGSKSVRVLKPTDAATMDFRQDRLNINTDEAGVIESLRCG